MVVECLFCRGEVQFSFADLPLSICGPLGHINMVQGTLIQGNPQWKGYLNFNTCLEKWRRGEGGGVFPCLSPMAKSLSTYAVLKLLHKPIYERFL